MKVSIIKYQSNTGYAIKIGENICPLDKTAHEKKTGINWIILPENPTNRKLINPSKLVKLNEGEEYNLSEKSPRKIDVKSDKNVQDYLTDEEKEIIKEIYERAKVRMNDPLEKARREYERAKVEYEKALEKAGKVEA